MSPPPSRAKTVFVAVTLAGGLAYGAVHFGQLAFGQHDAAPQEIGVESAASQPENKWATVRGQIDPKTLIQVSHPLGHDQVAFRLIGAGEGLVVLTNTSRHPMLADEALWKPGLLERLAGNAPADKSLQSITARFLLEPQTFTGVITEPGSGMNKEDHVELDGDKFKVTGFMGSYCGHVTGCPAKIRVLLVGEQPRGRVGTLAAAAVLGLLALALLAVGIKRPEAAPGPETGPGPRPATGPGPGPATGPGPRPGPETGPDPEPGPRGKKT